MQALEGAGFVHLYGLASCLNALKADRRDFTNPEDLIDLETLSGEALEHEIMQRERKPEAKFSPHLFVQDRAGSKGERALEKAMAAEELERLAGERGVPIATVDKGVLNSLSGNRPHQGYVLRCGKLEFDSMPRLSMQETSPKLWLVLDEVVDPQNLGALLRSAYFIGGSNIGVMVCAKNSAPPSPVVSAASAGALELLEVYSTSNLPRTLNAAREEGFRIIGASSDIPNADAQVYDLNELPSEDRPTLLVLGSEGLGLRTLVAKACTDFVKIPGQQDDSGVDSLNVSVTGGILLWHLWNN
jgi:21S rRNA (GM2251-2'-O)-methyltransferase